MSDKKLLTLQKYPKFFAKASKTLRIMFLELSVKKIVKTILPVIILLSIGGGSCFDTHAVTKQEMEKAKAIAAKWYIRYGDNMAGYLDGFTPSSMSELQSKLTNEKDKELFNQFNKISGPADYASWDKEQLAAYWGGTAFANNKATLKSEAANNGVCKSEIKKAIGAMKIEPAAPPTPPEETAPAPAPAQPQAQAAPQTQETQIPLVPTAPADQALEEVQMNDQNELPLEGVDPSLDSAAMELTPSEEKEESSGTWVYITILVILVAIVVFLVVYAQRTMKTPAKSPRQQRRPSGYVREERRERDYEREQTTASVSSLVEDTRMREKYAESLASKAEEIRSLTRQISELELLNSDLKEENMRLKRELERMRQRQAEDYSRPSAGGHEHRGTGAESPASGTGREIYLGRVNAKGVFVRADRHPVDGQSVYELTALTSTSGTFRIIKSPLVEARLLEEPGKWLAGGCSAEDIFDTENCHSIVTEEPGRAVFTEGAWRVESKARISYR